MDCALLGHSTTLLLLRVPPSVCFRFPQKACLRVYPTLHTPLASPSCPFTLSGLISPPAYRMLPEGSPVCLFLLEQHS